MKQAILNNLKNIPGWKTKRKLVAFAIDDYGNVRTTKKIQAHLNSSVSNRFDFYDNLETREDLDMLYEVLTSVKDKNKLPAIFTPYALSTNMDFEAMETEKWKRYIPELLSQTYEKLSATNPKDYGGTWNLWQEGIQKGIMRPQFHGREHFNVKVISDQLSAKNPKLRKALDNRSLCGLNNSSHNHAGWTAAFSFWAPKEITSFKTILETGIENFEKVYGYKATCFTPPAQQFPTSLERILPNLGLKAIDKPFYRAKHMGLGKYKQDFNYLKYNRKTDLLEIVRNVVFEPTDSNIDHVGKAMKQIEAAFFWGRPAIISSHRVNFAGLIDPKNREKGLGDLQNLLHRIVDRWPEVEFMEMNKLAQTILASKKR